MSETTAAVPTPVTPPEPAISAFGKWMALLAALLGWLFDGLEMGLFPLVQNPALRELLPTADDTEITHWRGIITSFFLVGAATGGVLFGWLGDRVGRVRAMMLSVLTYALVSALCGFATEAWHVGVLRYVAALGMGGEWSLGVALLCEVWPNRSRAFLAGLIGAAANVGYLLIAVVGLTLLRRVGETQSVLQSLGLPEAWTEQLLRNEGWRFLMMLGAVPALLTFFIRAYVPESARWERERDAGTTSHWARLDLLGVLVGSLAACGLIALWAVPLPLPLRLFGSAVALVVITGGFVYPVMQYLKRAAGANAGEHDWRPTLRRMLLAACLSGVPLLVTWGAIQQAPAWADDLAKEQARATGMPKPPAKEMTQIATAFGAVAGTIVAALLGGWLGRRFTYCLLCLGSLAILPLFFREEAEYDFGFLLLAGIAGAITASFYGWLPLYLPELFRTSVRATGQGFGFNFGRIIAAVGVLQLGTLREFPLFGSVPRVSWAMGLLYVAGLVLIWFVPETKGRPLPD